MPWVLTLETGVLAVGVLIAAKLFVLVSTDEFAVCVERTTTTALIGVPVCVTVARLKIFMVELAEGAVGITTVAASVSTGCDMELVAVNGAAGVSSVGVIVGATSTGLIVPMGTTFGGGLVAVRCQSRVACCAKASRV